MKKISFTEQYLKILDELLFEHYNDITTREHYLLFLLNLEDRMAYCNKNQTPWINNNYERNRYGQVTINKKRHWRMDILIKTLSEKDILFFTSFNKSKGLCRSYYYTVYFEYLLNDIERTIVQEEIPDKLYTKIISNINPPTDPYLIPQYNLLKSDRFKIDINKATNWINSQNLTTNKSLTYFRYIEDLNDKRIIVIKGEHSNRLFSNFNMMKRELRDFCYIDNKPLISIDLKSSQPYLFASYMLNKYNTKDSKKFYELVINDDIYNWFLNKWNEYGKEYYMLYDKNLGYKIKKYIKTRDDAKPEFLKLLFKIKGNDPPFTIIFKNEFPSLYKSLLNEQTILCLKLQKQESNLFVHLCNLFANKGCLSVHDQLCFIKEIEEELINELKKRFNSFNLRDYTLNYK